MERAYVEDRLFDWLTFRFGRQPLADGSIEADYSSMDQYYISHYFEVVAYQVALLTTGADLDFKFGNHTFQLQAFNGVQEAVVANTDTAKSQNKSEPKGGDMIWALSYRSSLFDGLVKPIISYDQLGRIRAGKGADRDDKVAYHAFAAGAQFSALHADLDLEYDTFWKPAFTSHTWNDDQATAVHNEAERIGTVVTQLAYNLTERQLRPFVKWSRDIDKTAGTLAAIICVMV